MSFEEKVESLLGQLGLTQYEARVFLELYRKAPQTASSISALSKVSRGRIYDVLQSLSKKGLVIEKPRKGSSPNIYEMASFPSCLMKLKEQKISQLEQEIELVQASFLELQTLLTQVEREILAEEIPSEIFTLVKGEASTDYYTRKLISEAKRTILTNLTAELVQKYRTEFLEAKKRKVKITFILSEMEYPLVKDITKGSEVYAIRLADLNPQIGFENMRTLTQISDKDKRHKAEEAFLQGQSPSMVVHQFKKQNKNMDPVLKLKSEKNRIEKTIHSLGQRLEKINEKIIELEKRD